MVIEFHNGIRSSGKLYGFGLPVMGVLFSVVFVELLEVAASELSRATDELENSIDELMGCAEEFVCESVVVVSIIKLICFLLFCGKDSVNEFIGEKFFSNTSSANVVENAPKIAMMKRILSMDRG